MGEMGIPKLTMAKTFLKIPYAYATKMIAKSKVNNDPFGHKISRVFPEG